MIINILIAYGTIQALFIALILIRSAPGSLFKKLFALLLIVEGITLFERLMVETEMIEVMPHLLGISYPISFLKPPLMLLMTFAITIKGFKMSQKSFLHFIPFALMLLSNIPFYFQSGAGKLEFVEQFMNQIPSYQSVGFYFSLSFFLYIGIYIYLSVAKLNQFRNQVTNNILVNWYRLVLLGYSAFLVLHLIYFVIQPLSQLNFATINQMSMLAMTFIIQSIAFKVIDKSSLFNVNTPDLSNIPQRKMHEQLILDKFESDKIYLDEDLSLQKFAESISLSPSYVSRIINQRFNCSFKKLVNRYRINEAKQVIRTMQPSKVRLIDISYRVGFNNKVSFYRAFKEFERISPSQYLERVKSEEIL